MKMEKLLVAEFSDEVGASKHVSIVCQYCEEQFEGTGFQIGMYGEASQGKCPDCGAYQSQMYYFVPEEKPKTGQQRED